MKYFLPRKFPGVSSILIFYLADKIWRLKYCFLILQLILFTILCELTAQNIIIKLINKKSRFKRASKPL